MAQAEKLQCLENKRFLSGGGTDPDNIRTNPTYMAGALLLYTTRHWQTGVISRGNSGGETHEARGEGREGTLQIRNQENEPANSASNDIMSRMIFT